MNTYTWVISALDCVPSLDGRTNVVSVAHWRLNATDGNHTVTSYGAQYLGYANNNAFAPFVPLKNDRLSTSTTLRAAASGSPTIP